LELPPTVLYLGNASYFIGSPSVIEKQRRM
jgi:hypothetical protein